MTGLLIAACNPQLKWRKAQQHENKKPFRQSPSCAETPDTNLFLAAARRLAMHGAHYRLISIQSSQLKLYRGCISLPGLGAICRPLSRRLYQWRSFPGEHLGLRRQSMKWNALGSLLCLLSKHGQGRWSKCVATGCSKPVRDVPEIENLQWRFVFQTGEGTVAQDS